MHHGSKVCFQFRDLGFCSYGTNCRYSHTRDTRSRVYHPEGRNKKKTQQPCRHPRRKSQQDLDAISSFFSQYPGFAYNPQRGVAEEFYRMCNFFAWDRDDSERREARQAFKDAMVIQFNSLYGTDISNIENWHKLCIAVNIEPLPTTIAECKQEIEKIHVNLVDLVDTSRQQVELFSSLEGLREYTIKSGKYFPKESAYAGGVLKFLLRQIFS
ncbi:hypothetical protein P154DRAFT_499924 [Amniculicola lignicola CBS 123094]|uniref:C3H1-type domain-containing protein n=1 Tax=Amniculicola lignicola CBS 123094 TaxID=1392246 RepID=A0A6A5W1K0_9PLEO|nr:hypothetical protein P154DRAFT_499924 [Amniculicola lignicola CBS 123094]